MSIDRKYSHKFFPATKCVNTRSLDVQSSKSSTPSHGINPNPSRPRLSSPVDQSKSHVRPMEMTSAYLLAGLAGVLMHVLVFRIGEWDVASPSIFSYHVVTALVASWASAQLQIPAAEVAKCSGYYVAGLYLSMLLYRVCFHRLRKYPGPFLAKITNFYITARSFKKFHLFEEVQKLHSQYGDYVRLGPSELSITDPDAIQAIYGMQSPTIKGPWYTILEPQTPLFTVRDKKEHARRRKVWDQGFSTKALLAYDDRITKAIDQLLHVLDRDHKQPINITKWINFFAFDVMEDLAFNKKSNHVRDGEEKYIFKTIRKEMANVAFFTHLPWLLPFLKRTPLLNNNYLRFWNWIQAQIDDRKKNEPDQPDIFSWILADFNRGKKTKLDRLSLHGDAQLIVVAGSDSTAAALAHTFFELAYNANLVKALQKELDALPSLAHDNLIQVSLLDAVINEALRLHPPVPSGTQRITPPEGLQIGEKHIPGNTVVQVPSYTVFRDPRSFEDPDDFIPDRWTTRQDLIKNRSVFIPFSTGIGSHIYEDAKRKIAADENKGPYGCVGKRLAMMEIRRVVSEILWRYDIRIADGQSREEFLDGKQDTFTLVSAPLSLVFTPRRS